MGKGDKKSRKGKIWRHSYGVTRPRKVAVKTVAKKSATKKSAKKAAPKKEKAS
jgi:30S ribosomal protein S31